MSSARRLVILSCSALATLVLTASVPGPEDANWQRLWSMPREERVRLAEKLKAFDALPVENQTVIRDLDRAIRADGEDNRANNYAALRRYHLWLGTLTDSQRAELAKAPPENRMALVANLLTKQRASRVSAPFLHQVADFSGVSPYELATLIKVWLKITPAQQAEVVALAGVGERGMRLHRIAREEKLPVVIRPTPEEIDTLFQKVSRKNRGFPALKKMTEEKQQRKFKDHVAEYYSFVEHPPQKVKSEKLYEFDKALPSWLRSPIEDAPPDEARWLLTNLYRLIFPAGTEMEARKPSQAVPGKPAGPRAKGSAPPAVSKPQSTTPKKSANPPPTPKSADPF